MNSFPHILTPWKIEKKAKVKMLLVDFIVFFSATLPHSNCSRKILFMIEEMRNTWNLRRKFSCTGSNLLREKHNVNRLDFLTRTDYNDNICSVPKLTWPSQLIPASHHYLYQIISAERQCHYYSHWRIVYCMKEKKLQNKAVWVTNYIDCKVVENSIY